MGFEQPRKIGQYWEDSKELDKFIHKFPFHTTGKSEKDFEKGFSTALMMHTGVIKSDIITQIDKTTKVQHVFCFGKQHRPDMTLDTNGIAIELKFITYSGLREAIGQGFLYRLRYKFTFIILIISEIKKDLYYSIENKEEKDLHDILTYLAINMKIYTYIVPAFIPRPGIKKCISFFE